MAALFLVAFGLVTYYLIPFSILFEEFGMFIFIMNSLLFLLSIGMIFVAILVMHHM